MPHNTSTPHRRRFRFGLRTMFVVLTAFSLWLGWQAKIVRDRRDALEGQRWDFAFADRDDFRIPVWRQWLGDRAVRSIHIDANDDTPQFLLLRRQFPEALVYGPFTGDPFESAARAAAAKRMGLESETLFVHEAHFDFRMSKWLVSVSAPDGRQAILHFTPSGELEFYAAVP